MGVGLQLLGVMLAGFAIVWELLSKSELDAPQLDAQRRGPARENPWWARLNIGSPRQVSDYERQRYYKGANRLHDSLAAWPAVQKDNDHLLEIRGVSPDVMAMAEFVGKRLNKREELLAKDWERQKKLDDELRMAIVKLVNEQGRILSEDQKRRRFRVMLEMVGLLLVAVGTMIGS